MTALHNAYMSVAQLYLTVCDPMGCSLPGSSVHGIFQARILEWVAMLFSRGSSRPRDQTLVSCIAGRLYHLSHQLIVIVKNRLLLMWNSMLLAIISAFPSHSKKHILVRT